MRFVVHLQVNQFDMYYQIHISGVPEREEKEKGSGNSFKEIMAENFPNLKEMDIQIDEAQNIPNGLTKRGLL